MHWFRMEDAEVIWLCALWDPFGHQSEGVSHLDKNKQLMKYGNGQCGDAT